MAQKRTIGLVAQEKGGTGKTTFTDILNTACQAEGKETLVVDVDDGNSGFLRRCGKGSALSLSWDQPSRGVAGWIDRHLADKDSVLFDLGANLFASGTMVTQFLADVVTELQTSGARIVLFAVAAANSPGCGRLVSKMRNDFGEYGEVRIVEINTDGSGAFPRQINTLGLPRIQVDHIDPGLQAARLMREAQLLDLLTNPPEGYELAMALYAEFVWKFAKQATVLDIAGNRAVQRLGELAKEAVGPCFRIPDLDRADNRSIMANAAYGNAFNALRNVNRADRDEVYERALQFVVAMEAYRST